MHARRTALIFATHGIGALTGLIGLFFIGRFMGPRSYGAFGFAMGFLGLWMILADLGLERAHVRHITRGHPLGDCIATFRGIKLVSVLLFLLGASGSIYLWSRTGRLTDATGLPVLLAVLAYVLFFILRTIPAGTLNALKLTANVQMTVLAEHMVKLPLVIVAALFYGFMRDEVVPLPHVAQWVADHSPFLRPMESDQGGLLLAAAWAIAMLVSLLAAVLWTARQDLPRGRFDPHLARGYLLFALPLALGASTRILFANLDAVFIGWFLSAENVGYYFAADRLSALALIVPIALSTVFFPIFGELAARRELDVLNALAAGLQRALGVLMLLVVLFFIVFPAEGIRIFLGDPFLPAQMVLPWLALYVLFFAYSTVSTNVVLALGSPYVIVRAGLAALLVNLVLNLLFIPDALLGVRLFGLHSAGAAVSTMIAQAVAVWVLERESRRLSGGHIFGRSTLKQLGAATLTAVVLYALRPVLFGATVRVWELLFAGLLGTMLYALLLVLFRELTRSDLALVSDAVHPRRMVAYIRDEVRDKRER